MKKLLSLALLACSAIILTACGGKTASAASYGPSDTEVVEGYQQFSEANLKTALDAGDNVVLFFGATRCPPCVKLHNDIVANADNIPENLTVLTADFDKADALKETYGVTKKHTAVYFKGDGSVALKNTSKEHKLQDIIDGFEGLEGGKEE